MFMWLHDFFGIFDFENFREIFKLIGYILLSAGWFLLVFVLPLLSPIMIFKISSKRKKQNKTVIWFIVLGIVLEIVSLIVILWSYFIDFERDSFYFLMLLFFGGIAILLISIPIIVFVLIVRAFKKLKTQKDSSLELTKD